MIGHMHGSLIGHLVPGFYFIAFAIYWTWQYTRAFVRSQAADRFHLTTWTPGRARVETAVKIAILSLAILGEANSMRRNRIKYERADGAAIDFAAFNAQHMSMYAGFLFAAAVELIALTTSRLSTPLPRTIAYMAYIFAFFNEAFLFACHLHGRNELDRFVHQVVVAVATVCGVAGIWELNQPHSFPALLFRAFCVLLQGTWFCYVGVLIHRSGGGQSAADARQVMYAAVMVTWQSIGDAALIAAICLVVRWRRIGSSRAQMYPITEEEEDVELEHGTQHNETGAAMPKNNFLNVFSLVDTNNAQQIL